jgi:transposase
MVEHSDLSVRQTLIDMVIPIRSGHSWQQQDEKAYDPSRFQLDWKRQQAICPQGHASASWVEGRDRQGDRRYEIMFNKADCGPCPTRNLCTHSKRQRRKITVRPQHQHELLQKYRQRERADDFKSRYAVRAGVEGTISQAVSALDMRRTRYRGLAKTRLVHVATAAAINIKRLFHWWQGQPFATTRSSPFAVLMAA